MFPQLRPPHNRRHALRCRVRPDWIRAIGLGGTVAIASLTAWLYATAPRTLAEVTGGLASSAGLYRVDPQSGLIDSIAALLTGDTWAVGQPMPMGYDVYNVPYGYQDRYYDTSDSMYRYSDGYVYQVDPTTQLVQAIIELIV